MTDDKLSAVICSEAEIDASEGAPQQWAHLLPQGEFEGRDGRRFRLSDPDRVIDAFRRNNGPIVVDYEHATAGEQTGPTPAAGWLTDLEARPDGLWGLIEWTQKARGMIAAREYRFLSPEILHARDGKIIALRSVGLVHKPNLALTALNRQEAGAMADADTSSPEILTALRDLLTLDDDAGTDAIIAAVRRLRDEPDPARFMPVEAARELLAERKAERAAMSERETDAAVDRAVMEGYITPAMRGWATSLCRSDPESFNGFLSSTAPAYAHLDKPTAAFNRPFPNSRRDSTRNDDAARIARQLGLDPKELD